MPVFKAYSFLRLANEGKRFKDIPALLEEINEKRIRPETEPGRQYTINAARCTVGKNKALFQKWAAGKAWPERDWAEFFRELG